MHKFIRMKGAMDAYCHAMRVLCHEFDFFYQISYRRKRWRKNLTFASIVLCLGQPSEEGSFVECVFIAIDYLAQHEQTWVPSQQYGTWSVSTDLRLPVCLSMVHWNRRILPPRTHTQEKMRKRRKREYTMTAWVHDGSTAKGRKKNENIWRSDHYFLLTSTDCVSVRAENPQKWSSGRCRT